MALVVIDHKNSTGALVWAGQRWNSRIRPGLSTAKAAANYVFFNQERKLGDPRWSDTVVVLTINVGCFLSCFFR